MYRSPICTLGLLAACAVLNRPPTVASRVSIIQRVSVAGQKAHLGVAPIARPPGYTGIEFGMRGSGRMQGKRFIPDSDPKFFILSVAENSPAEKAGLLAGDVVLEVNGQSIQEGGRSLGNPEAGVTYVLRIRRRDTEREVSVTAIPQPQDTR